jgi:integrase/recombinase XerD
MDLESLLVSWLLALRGQRKSPDTLKTYGDGVRAYLAWCARCGLAPSLSKDSVIAFTVALLDAGKAPATALSRQAVVKRFSAWLAAEGEIGQDELAGIRPPHLDEAAVEPLTADQITALLATCKGREFRNIRDDAIIRFMVETGARASEVIGMGTDDIDLTDALAIIRRGKGGKGRMVPFSPQCVAALDRYVRARRRHRLATSPDLWLGERGRGLAYAGLYTSIARRGDAAGIPNLHPHVLRNTAAVRWLRKGGSPTGLMSVAGWTSVDMLRRYIRAAESGLAADESRRLDLGDL